MSSIFKSIRTLLGGGDQDEHVQMLDNNMSNESYPRQRQQQLVVASPFDLCQTLFRDDNGDDQQRIQQDILYHKSGDAAVSTFECDEIVADDMHIQEGERNEVYLVGNKAAVEKARALLQESYEVVTHKRVNHLSQTNGSSQHSPLHLQQHTYEYTLLGWRGKLYGLTPLGTWHDCGTGRITISPSRMLCMHSEASSQEISKVLLQTPISHDIEYKHDGEKTISWIQPKPAAPSSQDTSAELALSFAKKEGCLDILKHLSVGQVRSLDDSLSHKLHDSTGGGEERILAETERISVETESLYKEHETKIQSNLENIRSLLNNFMTNTLDSYLQETEEVEKTYIKCRAKTQTESRRLEKVKTSFLALKAQESLPRPASQDAEFPLCDQESQTLLPANDDTKANIQSTLGKVETTFDNFLGTMNSYFQETEEVEKKYIKCRDNTQKERRRLEQVQNDFLALKAQESKPKLSTASTSKGSKHQMRQG